MEIDESTFVVDCLSSKRSNRFRTTCLSPMNNRRSSSPSFLSPFVLYLLVFCPLTPLLFDLPFSATLMSLSVPVELIDSSPLNSEHADSVHVRSEQDITFSIREDSTCRIVDASGCNVTAYICLPMRRRTRALANYLRQCNANRSEYFIEDAPRVVDASVAFGVGER